LKELILNKRFSETALTLCYIQVGQISPGRGYRFLARSSKIGLKAKLKFISGMVPIDVAKECYLAKRTVRDYELRRDYHKAIGWLLTTRIAAGSDGIRPKLFRADRVLRRAAFVRFLQAMRHPESITWDPIKHTSLPKPDGTRRPITILTCRDQIIQALCLALIVPIAEAFLDSVYISTGVLFCGSRAGFSSVDAYRHWKRITKSYKYTRDMGVATDDIEKFFPSVKRTIVRKALSDMGVEKNIIDVMLNHQEFMMSPEPGLSMGSPTSPLLSMVALGWVLKKEYFTVSPWCQITSYVDDITFVFQDVTVYRRIRNNLMKILGKYDLNLKPSKSQIAYSCNREQAVIALGWRVKMVTTRIRKQPGIALYVKQGWLQWSDIKITYGVNEQLAMQKLRGRVLYNFHCRDYKQRVKRNLFRYCWDALLRKKKSTRTAVKRIVHAQLHKAFRLPSVRGIGRQFSILSE